MKEPNDYSMDVYLWLQLSGTDIREQNSSNISDSLLGNLELSSIYSCLSWVVQATTIFLHAYDLYF